MAPGSRAADRTPRNQGLPLDLVPSSCRRFLVISIVVLRSLQQFWVRVGPGHKASNLRPEPVSGGQATALKLDRTSYDQCLTDT